MLLNTPIGYIRWEPIRAFKQWWLWLTASKYAKTPHWSNLEEQNLQARDFTVGELLYMRDWPWAKDELVRRRMPVDGHWAEAIRGAYPDKRRMHIADKMFRAYVPQTEQRRLDCMKDGPNTAECEHAFGGP